MEIRQVIFVKSAEILEQMPNPALPEVAFIGRSNVGKSALLNMLCQRKSLARTSTTPGKTQTFNFYEVNHQTYFVDIPGYGYAKVSKKIRAQWRRRIADYLIKRESLVAVLHLIDSRHPPSDLDKEVIVLLRDIDAQRFLILTKADKLSGNKITQSIKRAKQALEVYGEEIPIIVTSAHKRTGQRELLHRIETALSTK